MSAESTNNVVVADMLTTSLDRIQRACSWRHGFVKSSIARSRAAISSSASLVTTGPFEAFEVAIATANSYLLDATLYSINELVLANAFADSGKERELTSAVMIDDVLARALPAVLLGGGGTVRLLGVKIALTAATTTTIHMCLDSHILCINTCFEVFGVADNTAQRIASTAALSQISTSFLLRLEKLINDLNNAENEMNDYNQSIKKQHKYSDAKSIGMKVEQYSSKEIADEIIDNLICRVAEYTQTKRVQRISTLRERIAKMNQILLAALRIFLRLSMNRADDAAEMRMQELAREMIILMLRNAGPGFRSTSLFIEAFQEYLENAFVSHCVSRQATEFRLAMTVLGSISLVFSTNLSHSICIVVNHIASLVIEKTLESEHHVLIYLELLAFIAARPRVIADVFVPMTEGDYHIRVFTNVFKMLENVVISIVKPDAPSRRAQPRLVQTVRILGLIAVSLLKWLELLQDSEKVDSKMQSASTMLCSPSGPSPQIDTGLGVGLHLITSDVVTTLHTEERPPSAVSNPVSPSPSPPPSVISTTSSPDSPQLLRKNVFTFPSTSSTSLRPLSSPLITRQEAVTGLSSLIEEGWPTALAALSLAAEHSTEQPDFWRRCIDSYKAFIMLALRLEVSVSRQAFIAALVNSARLVVPNSRAAAQIFTITPMQLYAIESLLDLALKNGNYLDESWEAILQTLSQLEHVQDTLDEVLIERTQSIYTGCISLSSEALQWFVRGLCNVSRQELFQRRPPWMYALPRLARIIQLSLHRDAHLLSMMWKRASEHFVEASGHAVFTVAHHCIESIVNILDMLFSSQAPPPIAALQNEFLDTLVSIMGSQYAPEVWSLIVRKVSELVNKHCRGIHSAWSGIIIIFTLAAREEMRATIESILNTMRFICNEHLQCVADYQADFITVLDMLLHSSHTSYRHTALQCCCLVASYLSSSIESSSFGAVSSDISPTSALSHARMQNLVQNTAPIHLQSVLKSVLTATFNVLELDATILHSICRLIETHAVEYGVKVWRMIAVDILKCPRDLPIDDEDDVVRQHTLAAQTILFQCIDVCVNFFITFYPANCKRFPDLLDLLLQLMLVTQSHHAKVGISCVRQLLEGLVDKFSPEDLHRVFRMIARSIVHLTSDSATEQRIPNNEIIAQCILELVADTLSSLVKRAVADDIEPLIIAIKRFTTHVVAINNDAEQIDSSMLNSELLAFSSLFALISPMLGTVNDAVAIDLFLSLFQSAYNDYSSCRSDMIELCSLRSKTICLALDIISECQSDSMWNALSHSHRSTLVALIECDHINIRRKLLDLMRNVIHQSAVSHNDTATPMMAQTSSVDVQLKASEKSHNSPFTTSITESTF